MGIVENAGGTGRMAVISGPSRATVDLLCHSGRSIMARSPNHPEAIRQAEAAGMHATLFKDLYYPSSAHPVEGFREVIGTGHDLGYDEDDARAKVTKNARRLTGIEPFAQEPLASRQAMAS